MGEGEKVRGVTCLDDEVFIVCDGKAEVQVFDVNTLSLKRRLLVTGLISAYDLASCEQNSCVYSCNYHGDSVFKIDVNGKVTNWNTKKTTYSLSVTAKSNVLVTSRRTSKLIEFTADGRFLREIYLHPVMGYPYHSVQLSNDQFLVCCGQLLVTGESDRRVYVINNDGKPIQTYSGGISAMYGNILRPYHLVVDKQGFIAAVDYDKHNVVLLSPSLTYVRELISGDSRFPVNIWRMIFDDKGRHKIANPIRMYFDERHTLLSVANFNGGLSVFKGQTMI